MLTDRAGEYLIKRAAGPPIWRPGQPAALPSRLIQNQLVRAGIPVHENVPLEAGTAAQFLPRLDPADELGMLAGGKWVKLGPGGAIAMAPGTKEWMKPHRLGHEQAEATETARWRGARAGSGIPSISGPELRFSHSSPRVMFNDSELVRQGRLNPQAAREVQSIMTNTSEAALLRRMGIAPGITPLPAGGRAERRALARFQSIARTTPSGTTNWHPELLPARKPWRIKMKPFPGVMGVW